MPVSSMPAINQEICTGWTENQITLYQSLDFYLAKMQVERRKTWPTWSKFFGKIRWTPNQGPLLRGVRAEPSPNLRQFAMPRIMSSAPMKDVMDVREVIAEANVRRHRFESPAFNFFPAFNDFMDHIDDNGKDIMEKIDRFEDLFLRTMVWHCSPYVFVALADGTVSLQASPNWSGLGNFTDGSDGKTAAWLTDMAALNVGPLTLSAANHALTIAENDLRIPFFKGSGMPSGDDKPLDGMYCLVTGSETYNSWTFDPYLQQNKNCDLDVVNQSYRGKLFGRITCRLEDMPLQFTNAGVFHAPEARTVSEESYLNNQSLPNDNYTSLTTSPNVVSFFVGASGYDAVEVGPPPSKFTSDTPPHNFPAMFWNGKVKLTKRFLVPCIDSSTGEVTLEENTYGEYLKFISQAAFGALPKQRRFIIPIIHARKRLPSS